MSALNMNFINENYENFQKRLNFKPIYFTDDALSYFSPFNDKY